MEKTERVRERIFYIESDINTHADVKKSCAAKGITMKKWILRAIFEQLKKDKDAGII